VSAKALSDKCSMSAMSLSCVEVLRGCEGSE
jgi:hypothetical protein